MSEAPLPRAAWGALIPPKGISFILDCEHKCSSTHFATDDPGEFEFYTRSYAVAIAKCPRTDVFYYVDSVWSNL